MAHSWPCRPLSVFTGMANHSGCVAVESGASWERARDAMNRPATAAGTAGDAEATCGRSIVVSASLYTRVPELRHHQDVLAEAARCHLITSASRSRPATTVSGPAALVRVFARGILVALAAILASGVDKPTAA